MRERKRKGFGKRMGGNSEGLEDKAEGKKERKGERGGNAGESVPRGRGREGVCDDPVITACHRRQLDNNKRP